MGKAKLKTRRRKNMAKHKQEALMKDIIAGHLSREELLEHYEISPATYYAYAAKAKARPPMMGPFKPTVVPKTTEEGWLMNDVSDTTRRYLKGMAMAFDKTVAEVIDDLVDVAVEIGTAHIHAKKEK